MWSSVQAVRLVDFVRVNVLSHVLEYKELGVHCAMGGQGYFQKLVEMLHIKKMTESPDEKRKVLYNKLFTNCQQLTL